MKRCIQILFFIFCIAGGVNALLYGDEPESSDSTQVIKQLTTKWDADIAGIASVEVRYRRCAVSFDNLKNFTPKDFLQSVQELETNRNADLFDLLIDKFVAMEAFERDRHPSSTKSFRQRIVSNNTFRWRGKQRWEKYIHPGGFKVNGKDIPDFYDIYYTDDEQYAKYTQGGIYKRV